jgi:DNA-binding MarR family transcriptional regulator
VTLAHEAAELRLAITRVSRQLRQHGSTDVTPSMISALSSIERAGPLTLGELAALERVQPPSMTRIVAALEERDLVARQTDARDRRVARVRLTTGGERFLKRSRTHKDAYLARRLASLEPAERDALRAALPVLRRLAEEDR